MQGSDTTVRVRHVPTWQAGPLCSMCSGTCAVLVISRRTARLLTATSERFESRHCRFACVLRVTRQRSRSGKNDLRSRISAAALGASLV